MEISLFIERVALKGFKSFGEQVDIELSEKYTVIAGPNGSGKSNILDAVRWALGEQSPSRLRISKQSDLLFQGSPSRPPAREARVSFVINDKGKLKAFKRVLDESGSSFFVDGKKVKLYEMEEEKRLLGLEGIDFAFIGQGEVLEAIKQKPAERRENLEVLFGISQYRRKREEALLKLIRADEEALRLKTLIDELKRRRSDIHPQVISARKKRELDEELKSLSKRIKWLEYCRVIEEIKDAEDAKMRISGSLFAARLWVSLWQKALSFFENQIDALASGDERNREIFDRLSSEIGNLKKKLSSLALERSKTRDLYFRTKEELESAYMSMEKLRPEEESLRLAVKELKEQLAGKRRLRDDLEAKLKDSFSKIKELSRKKEELLGRKALCETSLTELNRKVRYSGKSYGSLITQMLEAKEELSDLQKSASDIALKLQNEERVFEELSSQHMKALAEAQATAAKLQSKRKERAKLNSEIERTKDVLSSGVYPRPVEYLMAAKRLGRLKVDFDPFVDAISCPKEYIPALQSFLGGRQFWILVPDERAAGECIEYLKVGNAGRATFLPLSRANPQRKNQAIRVDGKKTIGWFIDLISYNPKWENCVMHLLGNLLLASDYGEAVRISGMYRNFSVVTLDGEVFLPGGTISGGSANKSSQNVLALRGYLRESSSFLELLDEEIERLSSTLSKAEEREIRLKEDTQRQLALVDRLKGEMKKISSLLSNSESRIKDAEAEVGKLKKEIKSLIVDMKKRKAELEQISLELSSMEEIDLNDRLQSDLSSLDREVELLQERIRGRQDVLDRIEDELSAHRERIQQKREEILKAEKELANNDLKISELKGKYKELFFRRRGLAGDMKVAQEVRAKIENMFRKSSSKLQEARERMRKCESQLVLAKERLKNLYGQRAELEDSGFDGKESSLCDVSPVELERLKERARTLQRELQDYCDVDYGVLSEDASLIGRIDYLSEQYDDVKEAKRELDGIIRDTDGQAGLLFKGALKAINDRFNAIFVKLFGGGEANLALNDEFDLWNSGVEIAARPPGKRPQSLAQLSGGERSLTAIAYLFSTMEEARVPVAILDEVDASLDEANLRRFADLVEQYSKSLQIVAITHRRLTMERADIMYGVTLEEPGLSKIVSIKLSDWE